MAAAKGNTYKQDAKQFQQALRKALAHKSGKAAGDGLFSVAEQLVNAAYLGESWAIREIADRIDGKSPQGVILSGDEDNPVAVREIPFRSIPVDEDETV